MKDIQIRFSDGSVLTCPVGTAAETLTDRLGPVGGGLAAVRVNNEILPLSTRLEINAALEGVSLEAPDGVMIYRRSLAFLLAMAARNRFPDRTLAIGHSLGNSYYYTFGDEKPPLPEGIESLKAEMTSLVKEDLPIDSAYMAYAEALALFEKNSQTKTSLLLDQRSESKIKVDICRGYVDLNIEPLVPRTGVLGAFDLIPYHSGFLLCFPGIGRGTEIDPFEDSPRIFSVYQEHKKWGRIVEVQSVGQLNRLVSEQKIHEYIQVAEAFQANKIAEIAARIQAKAHTVKVILIAGPSSSGKTTTAKRLSIQLRVMGINPIAVSLDDYYVNKDRTPRDEKGEADYECLEALDVPYLNEQLVDLLEGKEVEIPSYDFKTGMRRPDGGQRIRLGRRTVLILEGIHGLNDALTPQIQGDRKFKIYVSALTQLNLDDHNRIPTSDNRLLRRMVRDYQFRGNSAAGTIRMWPSVQRGERKHIFPFQNAADVAFNSALDYELAVLKFYAEPLLHTVKPDKREYSEAVRLLSFLKNFASVPPQLIPGQSILREFIGGSEFRY
ncbi:MAG: nucleoside kinase [Spirochaetaceae bacterium]|jgi:uridine kinase|nr:nucleoside kinase [Spirochaetaceae bacterium]